jgi:hypothetical protein
MPVRRCPFCKVVRISVNYSITSQILAKQGYISKFCIFPPDLKNALTSSTNAVYFWIIKVFICFAAIPMVSIP